jgi:formylglycine-generating enzyme required for sulfatase activity/Leucine-rich repeat (LRR) protein
MKTIRHLIRRFTLANLILTSVAVSTLAQDVFIPDPGLNAAIRETLGKPAGPLTQLDLLDLTDLSAISRNITNLLGLEAARNLSTLILDDNHITDLSFPAGLTNLTGLSVLDLSGNPVTSLPFLKGLTNLNKIRVETGGLTSLTLPAGLTKLTELRLGFNQLPGLTLPADMTNLSVLSLFNNQLTNLTLPPNLTSLSELNLNANQLSRLTLPPGLTRLGVLIVGDNLLTSFTVPADMTNLTFLRINDNELRSLNLPAGLNHLSLLVLLGNQLSSLTLPAGMANLSELFLQDNQLTNLTMPPDLNRLGRIFLSSNKLARLALPPGLTNLIELDLTGNGLTNLTLPPDIGKLVTLLLDGNPLATLVLSEPLAASTNLTETLTSLRNQGVAVFTYPLAAQLVRPLMLIGAFKFAITGPPGVYTVLGSTNLATWTAVGVATNPLGSVNFHDVTANASPQKFYRALLQSPPTNMVFIPPNTFTMGSPTNEQDRNIFEGPPAAVTLTRGFWIGKYEVTQGEYLAVTGENPSNFPGDLRRPISSVSWFDATNYCSKLTQQELAAGRIPPGSHYRLPTEAEWECAARAGTTTRFSYGDDDQNYTSLTNYAWFLDFAHIDLIVHPVGQKLPNPWGIFDMHGHVWEWCQDWYADQPGGILTDPTGPPGPVQFGRKVMRGGAYDYPNSDCRSASRFFRPATDPDSDLGFRVVLVSKP